MTEISFYHLERSPLEAALPKLLEKTLAAGKRALVLASSEERVESLAQVLWTYDPGSWLPHGTAKDGNPEDQPIWLSTEPESANKATFLFMTDGATSDRIPAKSMPLKPGQQNSTFAPERWTMSPTSMAR